MKTKFTAILALIILALGSCKKDKGVVPEPVKTVKTGTVTLKNHNTEKDPEKAVVWFSISDQSVHAMEEISSKAALQKNIAFGYNLNDINWGLYSPTAYPHQYGQESWAHKSTTIFKDLPMTFDVFAKQAQSDPESINEAFINKMFADGSGAEASVKDFPEGAAYVFETADGVKGIFRVTSLAQNLTTVELKVWVLQ
ncbi:hypothetical protein [Parapedobacter tibetensis]|uniref:hypothetical protein n=1 Tax=Parapedobacter tibetensis TaxID=2972951 RepID=UPI00214D84F1|nr:hypothetical protein [Parapedobacter tibetensis]